MRKQASGLAFDESRRAKTRPAISSRPRRAALAREQRIDSKKSLRKEAAAEFLRSGPRADCRRLKKRKKSSPVLVFLIILLILLVLAAIASFLIFDQALPSSSSLRLTLAAPKALASGEEITLEVGYENLDKVPLEHLELVIQYPEGFFYNEANLIPQNQEKNIWQLEPLAVGQSGKLYVKGQLVGKVKEEKEFTVVFHYQPANFHSDFMEELSKKVKIGDTLLAVELKAPSQIEDGQEVEFKVSYKNNQNEEMPDSYLTFELGEAFIPLGNLASTTNYQWLIEKLGGKEKGEIAVKGKIDSLKANPFPWYFKIWQVAQTAEGQEQERIIFQESGEIEVLAPQVQVNIELLKADQKINWGEVVDYKITYKNTGKLGVKEAVLKLSFNKVIDWPNYNNQTAATLDGNTLVWLSTSGQATQGLAEIPVNGEGELIVSVPLIQEPEDIVQLSFEESAASAAASLSIRFNKEQKTFSSEQLSLPILSQARIIAEARYYLDAASQVGEGPLPPKIGQQTKYRIYWKLFTGSKGLSKVKVKTSLPAYINWLEPKNPPTLGAPLQFDSSSRQVVWEIEEVAPHSNLMASFDVAATPIESQVNQLLILTNPISLNAEEKETKSLVSKTSNLLTSDLVGDPVAQGKGRVEVGE